MGRIIKEFELSLFDEYDLSEILDGSPVFYGYDYSLNGICGRVVRISQRRKIINIEFHKFHPIYNILRTVELPLKLDRVYVPTMSGKLVKNIVLYMNHADH